MKQNIILASFLLILATSVSNADELKDASDKLPALTDRLAKLTSGKVAGYAKDDLNSAQTTMGAIKAAISAKNGLLALQKAEIADLQMTIAEAKTSEMESSEQLVLRRAELNKLDARFDQLLQAGGK